MPLQLTTPDDLEPIRQLLQQTAQQSARNAVQIERNTEGISQLKLGIAELRHMQQESAKLIAKKAEDIQELRVSIAELKESVGGLRTAMQRSYEDMVAMLTQYAEEAAADRQVIREMVAAMFRHQSNGGGQA